MLGVLIALPALARDFTYTYEGQTLTYTVIDEDAKTCKTKDGYRLNLHAANNVSGELILPSTISDGSITFTVTELGDCAFANCNGLTSITIPNSVNSIGEYAFYNCSGLTSIEIPNMVTSIGEGAFHDCSGLTSIEIPSSVTSIRSSTFARCSNLVEVTIPNTVSIIADNAFNGCSSLTSIEIPDMVTSIWGFAFANCSNLTEVYCLAATLPYIDTSTFYNTLSDKILYVSESALDTYKSSNWAEYFMAIEAIPNHLIVNIEGNGMIYNKGIKVANGTKYRKGTVKLFILADDNNQIISATLKDVDVKDQIINHILTIDDCEDAGTLKIVFAPINEASLTVKGTDSHALTHYYKEGDEAKIDLKPETGWKLYSLTFNGDDVTDHVNDNVYTTPALSGDNHLEVVMKSDGITSSEQVNIAGRKISFRRNGNDVEILNLENGEEISIYNAAGVLQYQGSNHRVTLIPNEIYILRTDKETLKFGF